MKKSLTYLFGFLTVSTLCFSSPSFAKDAMGSLSVLNNSGESTVRYEMRLLGGDGIYSTAEYRNHKYLARQEEKVRANSELNEDRKFALIYGAEQDLGSLVRELTHCYSNRGGHDLDQYGPGVTCYNDHADQLMAKIHAVLERDGKNPELPVLEGLVLRNEDFGWNVSIKLAPLKIFGLSEMRCSRWYNGTPRIARSFTGAIDSQCVILIDESEMSRTITAGRN